MKAHKAVGTSASHSQDLVSVESQVHGTGLALAIGAAGIVGLWAAASLIGGMIASGGPLALVGDWFKAVFGM